MSTSQWPGGDLPPTGAYRETNGLAIASLITGILAIVPVAIVLGIVALVQIGRRGDNGKGLAIAGIAISCAWVVIAIVGVIVLLNNIIERDADGRITEAGLVDELSLVPGDCVNDPNEDAIALRGLPCEDAHDAEVFARFRLSGDGWPGSPNIRRRATAGCRNRLRAFHPREYDVLIGGVTSFSPDRVDWTIDDHDVICFAKRRSEAQRPAPRGLRTSAPTGGAAGGISWPARMPKMKTHSGAKKRFKKTANGKIRARHAFTSHILEKKSPKKKRQLGKPMILSDHDAPRARKLLRTGK